MFRFWMVLLSGLVCLGANNGLEPEEVFVADNHKNNFYFLSGVISGGNKSFEDYLIEKIRFSKAQPKNQKSYERVVFEIKPSQKTGLDSKAPYFQVSNAGDRNQVTMTFFGKPKVLFDTIEAQKNIRKGNLVSRVNFFPTLDSDRWTVAFELSKKAQIEVFELNDPIRVIIDFAPKLP